MLYTSEIRYFKEVLEPSGWAFKTLGYYYKDIGNVKLSIILYEDENKYEAFIDNYYELSEEIINNQIEALKHLNILNDIIQEK